MADTGAKAMLVEFRKTMPEWVLNGRDSLLKELTLAERDEAFAIMLTWLFGQWCVQNEVEERMAGFVEEVLAKGQTRQ